MLSVTNVWISKYRCPFSIYDWIRSRPMREDVTYITHWLRPCSAILGQKTAWWRHQMETRYWTLCGEFTGHRWIPRTEASDAVLWFLFYLRLNLQFSKRCRRWWFETPLRSLWRHCNGSRWMWDSQNHADIFKSEQKCYISAYFTT